jgi:hypothetical protein
MAQKNSFFTIKSLIYSLIFLILTFILLLFFIIPGIKEYKSKKAEYEMSLSKGTILNDKKDDFNASIEKFYSENSKTIEAFEKEFDLESFKKFSGKYFKNIKIIKIDEGSSGINFVMYKFSAALQSKNPVNFYHFIEDLKNYDSVIEINFPIVLDSLQDRISISFHMKVYKLQE